MQGINNGTTISWLSTKQTLVTISTNYFEIISLYEIGKECVWLSSIISHIQSICQMTPINNSPTIIYEDNAAYVAQVKGGYIKVDKTKHISSKFFDTHELQESRQVDVKQFTPLIILQTYLPNHCQH